MILTFWSDAHRNSGAVIFFFDETERRLFRPRGEYVFATNSQRSRRSEPRFSGVDGSPNMRETSLPGVFAVGEVRSGNVKRVASAVGEGAIAVHLVHRGLAEL
jgi:NADPH-dependent glutamate synthase beta subunit-like oxidoreductase